MDARIRRLEVNLVTVGTGVAIFGLWTLIRYALTLFIFDDDIVGYVPPDLKTVIYTFLGVLIGIACLFQVYIGLSARGEGKGKRKSVVYLVFAGIGLAMDIIFSATEAYALFFQGTEGLISGLASLTVEITSIVCTMIMMTSSIRLRRFRKSMQTETEGGAV